MKTIDQLAREWLTSHEHYEHDSLFQGDLESLKELLLSAQNLTEESSLPQYDPFHGDEIECLCGHSYYRHFDPYDKMSPIGCKYCISIHDGEHHGNGQCTGFKEKPFVQSVVITPSSKNEDYCVRRIDCTCPDCRAPGYGGQKP